MIYCSNNMLNISYRNLPNIISSVRIFMALVLLFLALKQLPMLFIGAMIFTELTDILDGYLARRLNVVSELGAQLDSWGDFVVYITLAISAWLLWPDIVQQESIAISLIIASFIVPVVIGFIKFHKMTSYHTIAVKVSVSITIVAYVLLFTGLSSWPISLAAIVCLYAALEQIAITILNQRDKTVDIKSVWHMLKDNRLAK